MPISVNWGTRTITVPQSYMTFVSGIVYELDVNQLRLDLKSLEDDEAGMVFPTTHLHNTEVTLSGVTYARVFQIINDYVIDFVDDVGPTEFYLIKCTGANHNIADALANVHRHYGLIVGNAAGLITVTQGSGVTAQDKTDIIDGVWTRALEAGLTAEQITRIMLSALSGKSTGVGTTNEKYKSIDGVTDRLAVDFDAQGNRSAVTLNGA